MALTDKDKQDIRGMIREETADMRQSIAGLEVQFEHFSLNIKSSYAEIKSMLQDTLGLRGRVEVLEADVNVLKKFQKQ